MRRSTVNDARDALAEVAFARQPFVLTTIASASREMLS
jgi:hypothetical protein